MAYGKTVVIYRQALIFLEREAFSTVEYLDIQNFKGKQNNGAVYMGYFLRGKAFQ